MRNLHLICKVLRYTRSRTKRSVSCTVLRTLPALPAVALPGNSPYEPGVIVSLDRMLPQSRCHPTVPCPAALCRATPCCAPPGPRSVVSNPPRGTNSSSEWPLGAPVGLGALESGPPRRRTGGCALARAARRNVAQNRPACKRCADRNKSCNAMRTCARTPRPRPEYSQFLNHNLFQRLDFCLVPLLRHMSPLEITLGRA